MKSVSLALCFTLSFILIGQGNDCTGDVDGDGWTTQDGDCNDSNPDIHPGADDICDGIDNDCDAQIDETSLGTSQECPATSCLEIHEMVPDAASGTYYLDPTRSGEVFAVKCDMEIDGGGWTLMIPAYLSTLTSNSREYLYTYNGAWYLSPASNNVWNWSAYQPLNGTWRYSTGSSEVEGSFDCAHAEDGYWGVGCSNGPGGTFKCLPIYDKVEDQALSTICQDQPDVYQVGACASYAEIWVRP